MHTTSPSSVIENALPRLGFTAALIVLILMPFFVVTPAHASPLTIAVTKIRPYSFLDAHGAPTGALIDYWRLWSKKTGHPIQFKMLPWGKTIQQARTGAVDIIGGIFYTPERDKLLAFSTPFFDFRSTLFYRLHESISGWSDLKGKRVGVVQSDFHADLLAKHAPEAIPIEHTHYHEIVQSALNGKVDAFLMEHVVGLHYLNRYHGLDRMRMVPEPMDMLALRSAVREGNVALLRTINEGMADISQQELTAIIRRWTGGQQQPVTILTPNIPPVSFMQEGELTGLGVEVVREILKRLGRDDPIRLTLWSEAFQRVQKEPYTVLMPPSRTPEREALFQWVGPLIPEKLYLFGRKDGPTTQLKQLQTGAVKGYASERWLRENGYRVHAFPSPKEGIQALVKGEIDLWINSNITMAHTAQEAGVDHQQLQTVKAVRDLPAFLAFSPTTSQAVVQQWQRTLNEIKLDGTFDRIVQKWVPLSSISAQTTESPQAPSLNLTPDERAWIRKHPVIRAQNQMDWAPFDFNEGGKPAGYAVDLMNLAAKRAGLQVTYVSGPSWSAFMAMLKRNEIDV
ncbi:MAG: transporter substrate-binding domain-containing protein, partial [Magnetococcales bacterium]|nr:transporter substrate-binding domain-containing protein [Magnetococcales bacterium]